MRPAHCERSALPATSSESSGKRPLLEIRTSAW
jgi:hypothetical protein